MRNVWVSGVAWPDLGSVEAFDETCRSEKPTGTCGVGENSGVCVWGKKMDLEVQDVDGDLGVLGNDVVEAKMGDVAKEYDVGEQQVVVSGKERLK